MLSLSDIEIIEIIKIKIEKSDDYEKYDGFDLFLKCVKLIVNGLYDYMNYIRLDDTFDLYPYINEFNNLRQEQIIDDSINDAFNEIYDIYDDISIEDDYDNKPGQIEWNKRENLESIIKNILILNEKKVISDCLYVFMYSDVIGIVIDYLTQN